MTASPAPYRTGPLAGLRVLDLTRILAGPDRTQLLGDLGADVIKVERPGDGDDTRKWGPPYLKGQDGRRPTRAPTISPPTATSARSTIDIAQPEGQDLSERLAGKCDVLVENFKVGGIARYGLDYDALQTDESAA